MDIVRAQDVLQISGQDNRALLRFALIVLVPDSLPVRAAVDDIPLLDGCAIEADWAAGVIYIPLR